MSNSPTIRIGKTEYNVDKFEILENGSLCYQLKGGNSSQIKTLIGKQGNDWTLYSARNGMAGIGLPKLVSPIFRVL